MNNPYNPFDELVREQLASLDPEVPEGVWEAMESSLDALNQNLQFDAAVRESVEHIQIPAPEGVFQAIQSQLGSGILGNGLSLAGKWILGSVLTGAVATTLWFMTPDKNLQQAENTAVNSAIDKASEPSIQAEINFPEPLAEAIEFIPEPKAPTAQAGLYTPQQNPQTEPGTEFQPGPQTTPQPQPQPQHQPHAQAQNPSINYGISDSMICVGQTYRLSLLHAENCVYSVIINGVAVSGQKAGTESFDYPVTKSGVYYIDCRVNRGESMWRLTQFLYVNPLPEITLSKTDLGNGRYAFICKPEEQTTWYLDGGLQNKNSIQLYDPLPTDHRMAAHVTSEHGCRDSMILEFRNNVVFDVKAPKLSNVFTPNGDGKNDVYEVEIEGATYYHIYIFNSSSQLVFESTDPKEVWDGKDKFKQNQIVAGLYSCILDYALAGGKIEQEKEMITLIKE